ncbi:MAG TPA: AI-2E family transporter [Bacteroides graminisolvens]|uniref:AI-2E family transporter n=2 Tax=Bacteroides graminisolvens TaxID=477666 RepID=A0A3D2SCB6_9BACE|nr:AI-2E family transporter [Bacteroides graminisolvens]
MLEKKITFDSFIRMVLSMAIIVGILMLVERLSGVLLPFFIAWLIAYLLYPLVKFFQYTLRLRNRLLSIFAAFASIGAVGTAAAFLLVPPVMEEFTRVNDLLVMYFTDELNTNTIPHNLSEFIRQNIDAEAVNKLFSQENLSDMAKNIMPKLWAMLSDSIDFLFSIFASFIILLYIVFILLDYESIAEGWIHLLPVKYRGFVATLVSDMQKGMNTYFRGQALVAFCVGILFSIGFLLIDFPLAIGLGLFIGVLNLVPYLQIIGFIPTIALAMLKAAETGENFWVIIAMALVVFAVVQLIQDGFLVPRIMGKITGLNPAIILLSLSIWGSLMGMLGMIIALPITTLLLSYYQRYIIGRGQENNSPTESSDNEQISDSTEK